MGIPSSLPRKHNQTTPRASFWMWTLGFFSPWLQLKGGSLSFGFFARWRSIGCFCHSTLGWKISLWISIQGLEVGYPWKADSGSAISRCVLYLGWVVGTIWDVLLSDVILRYFIYFSTNVKQYCGAFAVCLCVILPCWWSRILHGCNEPRTPTIKWESGLQYTLVFCGRKTTMVLMTMMDDWW